MSAAKQSGTPSGKGKNLAAGNLSAAPADTSDKAKADPPKTQITDSDPFIRNKLYPDAFALLKFRPEPLATIKDHCIFVLDTNTLLLPYTVETRGLAEIRRVYEQLIKNNQLIIPGQVIREFVSHRADKLLDLLEAWNTHQSKLPGIEGLRSYPILESLEEYKEFRRNLDALREQKNKLSKSIGVLIAKIRSWNLDDPINTIYQEIFTEQCIDDLAIDEQLLLDDLVHRTKHRIPPGFGDKGKADKGIGDLIIWHVIRNLGQTRKSHVAFVSQDEKKGDWVYNRGDFRLFAKHELVDEFRRISDGKSFYDIRLADLLELFGTSAEIVEEVRQSEAERIDTDVKACVNSLYALLNEFHKSMSSYLSPMDFAGDPDKTGKFAIARDNLKGLYAFLETNRLLLPPNLYRKIEAYITNAFQYITAFNFALQREQAGAPVKDHWGDAQEATRKANPEFEDLIVELRMLLGY